MEEDDPTVEPSGGEFNANVMDINGKSNEFKNIRCVEKKTFRASSK